MTPMHRRRFLRLVAGTGLGAAGSGMTHAGALTPRWWPDDGLWNPCAQGPLPPELADHEAIRGALRGLDAKQLWDCHVHLIGVGDTRDGVWINPDMRSVFAPMQYVQFKFYLNASCVEDAPGIDDRYVERLLQLHAGLPRGVRLMLLAFDYFYDRQGKRRPEYSAFHTSNAYAAEWAARHARAFEWIASVHPHREDAVDALHRAARGGARAIKWLPAAMGIDPAAPRCDAFYDALVKLGLPLLTHAGDEHAVRGAGMQDLGNPLRLRRALERGVRVIVAHCASIGDSPDLDRGRAAAPVPAFRLFARMMDEAQWRGQLYGDISAITQVNRPDDVLRTLLRRQDWHSRLLYGSDYPLPGVMPLVSMRRLAASGLISERAVPQLVELRRYQPLLFDLTLKRSLRVQGTGFREEVFATRRVFTGAASGSAS